MESFSERKGGGVGGAGRGLMCKKEFGVSQKLSPLENGGKSAKCVQLVRNFVMKLTILLL